MMLTIGKYKVWNYRVVKIVEQTTEFYDSDEFFEIAEVFYDIDGLPYAYGKAEVSSDKLNELEEQLSMMKKALDQPTLNYPQDFKGDVNK